MNRILRVLALAAMVPTGCATDRHQYIMATKDGRLLISTTRPQLCRRQTCMCTGTNWAIFRPLTAQSLGQVKDR